MTIPLLDVGMTYTSLQDELDRAFGQVMAAGWFINGRQVGAFEEEFARYCGVKYAVGVGNGLDAIVVILEAIGIGPGDEILTSAHTFIATWLAIAKSGATVIPVDADLLTMNCVEQAFIDAITPRTKAIIPVHLYGLPIRLDRLKSVAEEKNILVIEDAAQAHGAKVGSAKAGSLGHAGAFSFYPGKNLGAFGDAGAIVTNDEALAVQCREIANYGSKIKYEHNVRGVNTRLDELQASFLRVKLRYLDEWNSRREEIAQRYISAFDGLRGVLLPVVPNAVQSAWHLFVIRCEQRGVLQDRLTKLNVGTGIHYPVPNHWSGAFKEEFRGVSFPMAEEICRTCLSLPIGPHLDSNAVTEVIRAVSSAVEAMGRA